jgi:hypothetical protein
VTYSQAPGGQVVELYPNRREHPAALVGAGAVSAWFLSRHHHPLVWAGLLALAFGAVALVVVAWWAVLAAVVIVTGARAHGRGWSAARYGLTAASWLGALVFVIVGAALAGLGGALVALVLAWGAWHVLARPRAHSLTRKIASNV